MKIEEGQKKQLIVLCCLIALVIGFGVYRVIGIGTQAAPPQKEKLAQTEEQSTRTEQTEVQIKGAEESSVLAEAQSFDARDPFAPQTLPKTQQPGFGEKRSPVLRANLPPLFNSDTKPPIQIMPPLAISTNCNSGISSGQTNMTGEEEKDLPPELRLTGVIEGSINVAIIRGPNNTRYIVREGQKIEGKFNVVSISRAGVKIAYNGKTFFLRLGGNNENNKGAQA